jgi:homoserine dehydrogenase
MHIKSFKEYHEDLTEGKITQQHLDAIETYADDLFKKVNVDINFTKHFLERVNDERNKRQISMKELTRLFREAYKKYGKSIPKLGKDAEAVLNDMTTDVNMPFILKWDGNEFDLVAKTVMRKKDFKTPDKKLSF